MRASQINDVLDSLQTGSDAPIILLGDFNAPPDASEFTSVREEFIDALGTANPTAAARSTLVTDHGHRSERIDHIFVETGRFDILSAGLAADRAVSGTWPSDHVAVVARLRVH